MFAGRATPPDNAKKGDIWFKDTGSGDVELYEFDGANWIRKTYKGFSDDVRQLVDSKIAEANVTITEALEEHDNTIAQAMTNAGQANDLAQQAKTEAMDFYMSFKPISALLLEDTRFMVDKYRKRLKAQEFDDLEIKDLKEVGALIVTGKQIGRAHV